MGNVVTRVDAKGLPSPVTQSIDEHNLRPTLSRWKLKEISMLKDKLHDKWLKKQANTKQATVTAKKNKRRKRKKTTKKQQLKSKEPANSNKTPFTLEAELMWNEFFECFEDVSDRVTERIKTQQRKEFHSSCYAYAMLRKTRETLETELKADEDTVQLQSTAEEISQRIINEVSWSCMYL